ncbi:MAG: chromosome segregation protein SMC [Clostridia bacterium]
MITFKEIEMTGFKSFADTTHINFDGGITGIVGPNGCGKSNVSDAIRWVLGEQSSKALRGKSMQDVIFAGTEKRKKLSFCEVSLIFDNTNKWFNVEYDEVVLTRKLYRSGESEYMINRKPCRLKDIRDILYDSGIGKDGYSIIGQGRVEEIIQSKPEERRSIFEEAAGIAKYKARKVETENRLVHVRDNLSRATDILTEVERRLGPLKRQSEDAKKYLEYRDQLKNLEINAYIYQYDHAAQTKEEINTKLAGYRDNLNILTNSIETEQAKYDKALNEINQLDRRASELHEKVLTNTVALEKKQSDSRILYEQTRHLKEQLDRLSSQLNAYEMDYNQRSTLIDNAKALREKETKSLAQLNRDAQQIADEYMKLIDELTKNEGEKEENQRNIIDNLSKLTDIKTNLASYIAKRDTMQENLKTDKEKLEILNTQLAEIKTVCDELSKAVENLSQKKNKLELEQSKLNAEILELNDKVEEKSNEIYALKTSISNDTNRMNILSNMQMDYEGYQYAVKRLMQESKKNPTISKAIKGVVANIISVDSKYQTAIEIALGGSIQNIVTQDEDDAKVLINYLKDNHSGRATFLPISAVKARRLSPNDMKFLTSKGCFGIASDLVKVDSQYKSVIDSLLGSTVVCDNYDNAVNLAKSSNYAFRIVTLDGEVFSPQGSLSGGSKKSNDSSLLGKENEIKNLKANIEARTKELDSASRDYDVILAKLTNAKANIAGINSELQSVNSEYYTNNTKMENVKQNSQNIEEDIFSVKSQMTVAQAVIDELTKKINSIDQIEMDYNATQAKVGEFNENNKNVYEELKSKREVYQERLTSVKVMIASTEEKIRALDKDIENNLTQLELTEKSIAQLKTEISGQQKLYDEAISLNKSAEDENGVGEIRKELDDLNNKLAQFDEFKQSLMSELKELDDKKSTISNDIAKMNNKIFQEETRLQKVDIEIETMQERIFEEYELTYNDCLKFKDQGEEFDIKDTMIQISRIKSQITALGYVNINAIEEYKTEGARYEEMNAQIEDLRKAEEDAVRIIKDLSAEMLEQFNAEFVKIQENFTKVFKELFGGGNARLELLPSDDPLTAGVDIIAQPPGKAVSNITLLSGGEKTMTAIAILFAILKLKPMPFCFLDEIEAALDDANIDRYANYLKRFSNDTQFIVITHRKPTMEVVDSLYGVTMEEKGVSKIVSVKLAEAVKAVNAE